MESFKAVETLECKLRSFPIYKICESNEHKAHDLVNLQWQAYSKLLLITNRLFVFKSILRLTEK